MQGEIKGGGRAVYAMFGAIKVMDSRVNSGEHVGRSRKKTSSRYADTQGK